MQPCRTPFEIGNASERTPSTLTLPSIPLCSDCRIRVNLSVQPNLLNTVQKPSLFTVSKAFERSTKRCNGPCFVLCIFLVVDEQQGSCQLFICSAWNHTETLGV